MVDLNIPEFLQDYGADFETMLQGWAGLLIGCICVMLIAAMYRFKTALEEKNKRKPKTIKPWGPFMGLLIIRAAYFGATIGGALIEISLDKAALTWTVEEFLPAVVYFVLFYLITEFIGILFMHENSPLNLRTTMDRLKLRG